MSTNHTAQVYIQNNMGGTAKITMCHQYSSSSIDSGTWTVASGDSAGPLTVNFETGFGTGLDYWYCSATVMDGPNKGIYVTEGAASAPKKECELEGADANSTFTNTVDTQYFKMNQPSGGCSTGMSRTGPYAPITNVFVLMLENRSFDHILGFSGIPGINGLTGTESNQYEGTTYTVKQGAVDPMTTDPNHELLDTAEQLCGQTYGPKSPGINPFPGNYPTINNSGFVANYAMYNDEDNSGPTGSADYGDVMACCTPDQVSVMVQLAQEFAVCDNWHASIPGPTWPNRLFAMAGTSSGLDATPSSLTIAKWESASGFQLANGSFFSLLKNNGMSYNLYADIANQFAANPAPVYDGGAFSIVSALPGIFPWDVNSFSHFGSDLGGAYPYQFTWIEPNYGNAAGDTYIGGSSQHPMDSLAAGEAFIAATYNAIRNSPLWETSLLIITYDEHGGFYDHVAPEPAPPPSPGNNNPYGYNQFGFDFSEFGIRVPAVIVSPLIAKGVDSTCYDHTSIGKTLEDLFGLPSLTERDTNANSLTGLLTDTLRTDCITSVTPPEPSAAAMAQRPLPPEQAFADLTPLPEHGNVFGHLLVAMMADIELSDGSPATQEAIKARVAAIKTAGQARQYFAEVWAKVEAKRAANNTQ